MKRKGKYTNEQLLEMIRAFERRHGHTPSHADCRAKNGLPSSTTFAKIWGNYNNAIRAAGFEPNPDTVERQYSAEELQLKLRQLGKEIGYVPIITDLRKAKGYPDRGNYERRYGNLKHALDAAGIKYSAARLLTRTVLIRLAQYALSFSKKLREPWDARNS